MQQDSWELKVDVAELARTLQEFYNGGCGGDDAAEYLAGVPSSISNERMMQLERQLSVYKGMWRQGLAIIRAFCGEQQQSARVQQLQQYVCFFGLHLLDQVLTRDQQQWTLASQQDREIAKQFLFELLRTQGKSSALLANKTATTIVRIAKLEWPQQWPSFFDSIFSICSNGATALSGLKLLETVAEEFTSQREDLPAQRKRALQSALVGQLPRITAFLQQVLETLFSHYQQDPSFFSRNVNQSRDIAMSCLDTLLKYLSWMPIEKFLPQRLLQIILQLAALTVTRSDDSDVCSSSLDCINEILSKMYVPEGMEQMLQTTLAACIHILAHVLQKRPTTAGAAPIWHTDLDHVEVDVIQRINVFLRALVQNHVHRIEQLSSNGSMSQFFELLFRYTFMQTGSEEYIDILETWQTFLMYMQQVQEQDDAQETAQMLERYRGGLMNVLEGVTRRSMFQFTDYMLDLSPALRKGSVEGQFDSELDQYLAANVECIGMIAEFYPQQVLQSLSSKLQPLVIEFERRAAAGNFSSFRQGAAPRVQAQQTAQHKRDYVLVRDIAFLMRSFSRCVLLLCSQFDATMQAALSLLQKFCEIGARCLNLQLHHRGQIYEDLEHETFLVLQMFQMQWVQQYFSFAMASSDVANQQRSKQIIQALIALCMQGVNPASGVSTRVSNEAAALFNKICADSIAESGVLFTLDAFHQMVRGMDGLKNAFLLQPSVELAPQLQVTSKLVVAVSNAILLTEAPAGTQPSLAQEEKRKKYRDFIQALLVAPLMTTLSQPEVVEGVGHESPAIVRSLQAHLGLLRSIVSSIAQLPKDCKMIVQENTQGVQGALLNLFALYIGHAAMLETLLELFQSIFDSLRSLLSHEFIAKTVESFLELLSSQQNMVGIIHDPSGRGKKVVLRFLQIQNSLAQEGSGRFAALTPKLVSLNRQIMYPLVAQAYEANATAQSALVDLVAEVRPIYYATVFFLLNNSWNLYFFDHLVPRSEGALLDFKFLLHCFLDSIKVRGTPDIETYRANLEFLKDLNAKRRLFARPVFAQSPDLLPQFLKALFDGLVARTHNMLREDICGVLLEMISVNQTVFVEQFVPLYIEQGLASQGLDPAQKQHLRVSLSHVGQSILDLHVFMTSLNDFVNDALYAIDKQK